MGESGRGASIDRTGTRTAKSPDKEVRCNPHSVPHARSSNSNKKPTYTVVKTANLRCSPRRNVCIFWGGVQYIYIYIYISDRLHPAYSYNNTFSMGIEHRTGLYIPTRHHTSTGIGLARSYETYHSTYPEKLGTRIKSFIFRGCSGGRCRYILVLCICCGCRVR